MTEPTPFEERQLVRKARVEALQGEIDSLKRLFPLFQMDGWMALQERFKKELDICRDAAVNHSETAGHGALGQIQGRAKLLRWLIDLETQTLDHARALKVELDRWLDE